MLFRSDLQPLADGRTSGNLTLKDAVVPKANLLSSPAQAKAALTDAVDTTLVMSSAELYGVMGRALDMSVDYMKTRVQFGKPIGSFQALAHRAVDLHIQRELSSAVLDDAVALFDGDATAARRSAMASRVKARCSEAGLRITREAIQIHGAFGVSRGGLWVMRLAAHDARIKALISCAPGGVGYWGTDEERKELRMAAVERAKKNWFGPRGTRPVIKEMSEEEQRKEFLRWSLKDNGLLDNLKMPMFLVNGKIDHLTPIGNLYMALESGPPDGRVARVYPDDGHIAAKNEREWGPAAWKWLRQQLTR